MYLFYAPPFGIQLIKYILTDQEAKILHTKIDLIVTLGGDGTVLWVCFLSYVTVYCVDILWLVKHRKPIGYYNILVKQSSILLGFLECMHVYAVRVSYPFLLCAREKKKSFSYIQRKIKSM